MPTETTPPMSRRRADAELRDVKPTPPTAEERFAAQKAKHDAVREREADAAFVTLGGVTRCLYRLLTYCHATGDVTMHLDGYPDAIRTVGMRSGKCDCGDVNVPSRFGIQCKHSRTLTRILRSNPRILSELPEPERPAHRTDDEQKDLDFK